MLWHDFTGPRRGIRLGAKCQPESAEALVDKFELQAQQRPALKARQAADDLEDGRVVFATVVLGSPECGGVLVHGVLQRLAFLFEGRHGRREFEYNCLLFTVGIQWTGSHFEISQCETAILAQTGSLLGERLVSQGIES